MLEEYYIFLNGSPYFVLKKEELSLRVETSQLIPGCIVSENIYGKTKHPIIEKNTILTEELIELLHSFLVEAVYISRNLNDGKPFVISKQMTHPMPSTHLLSQTNEASDEPFSIQYKNVVKSYERMFHHWHNNMPIDMPRIRKLLIPLIEWIEEDSRDVYHLYTYSNKENYRYSHDIAVSILSAFLARKMGYKKGEWLQIGLAGFLSNCGMAKINPRVFKKTTQLSLDELTEVKKHPVYSYRLIESVRTITDAVKLAVLQHHERLDGSGYPLALTKDKIHQYARIIAVSDTYLAMTSERVYQARQSPQIVLNELQKNHPSKLDPKIIHVLVNHFQD